MQDVILKGPRLINGAIRYPVEGSIPVTDEEYDRLVAADAIVVDDDDDGDDEDGLDTKTLAELKAIVTEEAVDLGTASRKADIVAAIRNHRAQHA